VQVALSGTVQVSGTGSPTPTQGHIATFYPGSAGLVQDSGQTDPGGASSPTSSLPGLAGATLVGKILGYNSGSGLFMLQLYGPGLYASRIASGTLANEPTTCAAMGLLYVATDQPIGAQIYTSTGTPPTCSWTAIGTVAATPSELAVRDTGGGLTSTSFATTGTTSTAFVLNQYTSGSLVHSQNFGVGAAGLGGGSSFVPPTGNTAYFLLHDGSAFVWPDTGSSGTVKLTLPTGIATHYPPGEIVCFSFNGASGPPSQISQDGGVTPKNLDIFQTQALLSGDFAVGAYACAFYDGAEYQIVTPSSATVTTNRSSTYATGASQNFSNVNVTINSLNTASLGSITGMVKMTSGVPAQALAASDYMQFGPLVGSFLGGSVALGATTFGGWGGATMSSAEIVHQTPITHGGTIKNLRVSVVTAQPADAGMVITLRKNGAGTPLSCTIASGTAGGTTTSPVFCSNTSTSESVSAGDVISLGLVNLSASASAGLGGFSVDIQ
jgi:hypothetical protein